MATNVVMEALSPTMEEGRLVEWKKQPGDAIAVGDVIAEVETDKAVMELVARASGTLLEHRVAAGATVPVAQTVAVIGDPSESAKSVSPAPTPDIPKIPPVGAEFIRPSDTGVPPIVPDTLGSAGRMNSAPTGADVAVGANAETNGSHNGERVKASPLAKRIAAERGIDLTAVTGTGPEGRIVQRDLVGTVSGTDAGRGGMHAAPTRVGAEPATVVGGGIGVVGGGMHAALTEGVAYTDLPLSQMRKTIAKRLVQSIGPIPTFYLTTSADMERMRELRTALPTTPKVSFNDIILKATALALVQHPECNAWWTDTGIRQWHEVHIGVAVAIDDGLITPVVRNADRLSLRDLSSTTADLVARAKTRKLAPDEFTGSTFSVSNLGMLGIDEFTAIINPPEAGILAIGRIVPQPVVHEGAVAVRHRMNLTMSCDHRVIDGATGARFLQTLVHMLENPLAMVW